MNLKSVVVRRIGIGRLLLFLCFFAFISLGLPDGLLGVAWPSISDTFNQPLSRLAVLQLAMTAGFFLSSTNAGRLMERLGVGTLLIASNTLIALALFGFAFGPSWWVVILSSVLLGSGGGAIDAGLNAYAAQRFSKEQVTTLHAFYGIGAMLGPIIMRQVIGAELPWQRGYLITLAAILMLLVLFLLSKNLWYRPTETDAEDADSPGEEAEKWSIPSYIPALGILLFLVYTGLEVTVGAWSYSLLTEGRNVPAEAAALWVGGYWAALTGGRLFFGILGSNWDARAIVRTMILTGVVGAGFFAQPWSPLLALLGLPILGFACAPLFPLFVILTPTIVGPREAPRLIGKQVAAANVGAAMLPLLVGFAVEFFNLEAVAYVLLLLAFSLTLLFPSWIRHSRGS